MRGRRIESPFAADGGLIGEWPKPGDFYFYPAAGWCGVTPNGHQVGLRGHEVVEHEDGTITVSPSILVSSPGQHLTETDDEMRFPVKGTEEWHGYLERGVWRDCRRAVREGGP